LDDLKVDYFVKQKKSLAEEQGIYVVVRGREGRDSDAKSGKE
jgi:hypothetical protein